MVEAAAHKLLTHHKLPLEHPSKIPFLASTPPAQEEAEEEEEDSEQQDLQEQRSSNNNNVKRNVSSAKDTNAWKEKDAKQKNGTRWSESVRNNGRKLMKL